MVKSYLSCFCLDTGAIILGLLQLNAALFFFFRWTTFQPTYQWFDLLIFFVYIARTSVFLHGCLKDDYFATIKSRSIYYLTFVLSTYALAGIIVL